MKSILTDIKRLFFSCCIMIGKIIKIGNINNLSKIFLKKHKKIVLTIFLFLILIGINLHMVFEATLPLFWILFILLILCLYLTYQTTTNIFNKIQALDSSMAGDKTLLILRTKYKTQVHSNIIYLPMLFFSFILSYVAYNLLNVEVDQSIIIYCFVALFVVVFFCTYGAIQYFLLILFIAKIKKNIKSIDNYDRIHPQNSDWLTTLNKLINKCNRRFLIVGLLLIIAFNIFSLTGKFGINISNKTDMVLLSIFWLIILFFIIFCAIFCSCYSNYCINSIQTNLISKVKNSLNQEYNNCKQNDIRNSYAIRIMLLSNLETTKRFAKNLTTNLLSIVDAVASIQATISLVNMIINDNTIFSIEKIYHFFN